MVVSTQSNIVESTNWKASSDNFHTRLLSL